MSIPATYHTHTTFSDGKDTPEEMILEALRLGMTEIGFSDHSYTPFDRSYCMKKERQTEYIDEIRRLSEKYRGRIRVLLGIEQDSCSEKPCGAYDYVIGSCHYLSFDAKDFAGAGPLPSGAAFLQNGRIYVPVDEGADVLKAAACALFGGDLYPIIEKYYETVGNIVEETECDLIGHFDLITKYNEDGRLFDEEDPRYRAIWQKAADRLLKTGKAFEINTRQVVRGLKSCPYPSPEIITYLAERGAHFVLSGDNHEKETLSGGFSEELRRISGPLTAVETRPIGVILGGNPYLGRGIIIGETPDGAYAAAAYFIMGRSENSRNRALEENEEGVETAPFDETKVSDPSLIIYPAVRRGENRLVVTNGDQTETILKGFKEGKEMTESLLSRTYEPDPPNFTPRISGVLT
ncbi:MAG: PHP domain-containing protein, partial [Lachnospiraceae bacterium]|nr:PHP domain-containing protein [Lachnospiraceae bacterium]